MSGRGLGMLRCGLILLAAAQSGAGLWLGLFPAAFYRTVPTVDRYPPFNEHILRDFGGASFALGVVLTAAAVFLERRLVQVALTACLVFAVPHCLFHLTHQGHLPLGEAVLQSVGLTAAALLPVPLLLLARHATAAPIGAAAAHHRAAGADGPPER